VYTGDSLVIPICTCVVRAETSSIAMSAADKKNSDSEDSTEELEESDLEVDKPGRESPCYIAVPSADGGVEHIQVRSNDDDDDFSFPTSGAFFNSGEFAKQDVESQLQNLKDSRSKSITKELKKAQRRRIVSKHGDCNIQLYRLSKKRRKFIKDVFTTCVDMRWRWTLLAFVASFFISWTVFGGLWWFICWVHGDFEPEHLPDKQGDSGWIPCILATHNFASAFLFSVETQHTIGYGSRQTTEECPEAIILQCIQSVVGVIIQACMAGIVFAKLARPKSRSNTVMFSRNAVVSMRNGYLCLVFRVGNMRSSQLLEAHLRANFVSKVYTKEGEGINFHQEELKVGTQLDGEEDRSMLLWPTTYTHKIDKDSPLWKLGPKELLSAKFEIIVTLEGIVEPTGNSVQARSSYLPNEILWAHRFENMFSYAKHKGVYAVDCSSMNSVALDPNTPRLSAKEIAEIKSSRKGSQLSSKSRSSSINHLNKKLSVVSQMSLPPGAVSRIKKVSSVTDAARFFTIPSQDDEEEAEEHRTAATLAHAHHPHHTDKIHTRSGERNPGTASMSHSHSLPSHYNSSSAAGEHADLNSVDYALSNNSEGGSGSGGGGATSLRHNLRKDMEDDRVNHHSFAS